MAQAPSTLEPHGRYGCDDGPDRALGEPGPIQGSMEAHGDLVSRLVIVTTEKEIKTIIGFRHAHRTSKHGSDCPELSTK